MKLKDIVVGEEYRIVVPEAEDAGAFWDHRYGRKPVYGVAVEVGVEHAVPEYVTYGGIAGTPRVVARHHTSERAEFVRFQLVSGRIVTIRAQSVKYLRPDFTKDCTGDSCTTTGLQLAAKIAALGKGVR